MLEKTEGTIKNGYFKDSGNICNEKQNENKRSKKTQHSKLKRGATRAPPQNQG